MNVLNKNWFTLFPFAVFIFIQHQSTNATPATLLKEDNLILWNSDVEPYEIRYNWTISNFSSLSGNALKFKQFPTSQNTKFSWIVGLDLSSNSTGKYINLYVRLNKGSFGKAVVKVKASIIDNQLREVRSKEKFEELVVNKNRITWDEFCKIDDDFRNQSLVDDQLTISLQISCFIQCSNLRMPDSSLDRNIIKCDLSDNLNSLLENPKFADVKLSVNGKSYLAHKAVLAARSRVFARLFEDLDEEDGKKRNKIIMNGTYFDEDVMKAMLQYIYTGKCEAINRSADRLLVVADEYELDGLKKSCSKLLEGSLSVENAINTLQLADTHHSNELKSRAIDFIVENSVQVLNTTEWKNMLTSNVHLAGELIQKLAHRLNIYQKKTQST
ncbi:protein roadkill-like [Planococcus citri]|uniref:protein roadkill-like n=1 Tax=Planococcus citri TaxID=170843 RepID=UPI0031F7D857